MSHRLCGIGYTTVMDGAVVHLSCQYLAGHGADRHSWYAVEQTDIAAGLRIRVAEDLPPELRRVAQQIEAGLHDDWLELLLSVLHDRKRTKRGVAGFPRR